MDINYANISPDRYGRMTPDHWGTDAVTGFNRIAWAVQYLKSAEAIEAVMRSIYRITPRGKALLEGNPEEITLEQLRQSPEFREFEDREATEDQSAPEPDHEPAIATKQTPEESLARSFQQQRDALSRELLDTIAKAPVEPKPPCEMWWDKKKVLCGRRQFPASAAVTAPPVAR